MSVLSKFLGVTALLFTGISCAATGFLNDTGITFCRDASTNTANCATVGADGGAFPRQDARYGRDAQKIVKVGGGSAGFDFTKIANNGSVLPESAVLGTGPTDWACTRDNVTGLTWEVKTTSGLRGMSYTYSWYNSNSAINGGSVGTASGGSCATAGRCDTEKFTADVNTTGLCEATNTSRWRMPTVKELEGITDLGRVNPSIVLAYFPNTLSSFYWSSSPTVIASDWAWYVSFFYGYAGAGNRNLKIPVRLVRDGQ